MRRAVISLAAVVVLGWTGSACAQPDFEGLGVAYGGPAPQQVPAQVPVQMPSQVPPTPGKLAFGGAPQEPLDASSWFQPAPAYEQPEDSPTHPRNTWNRGYNRNYRYGYGFNQGGSWNHARWYDYQGYHGGWSYNYRNYRPYTQPYYRSYYQPVRYGWDARTIPYGWRDRGYTSGYSNGYTTICYW